MSSKQDLVKTPILYKRKSTDLLPVLPPTALERRGSNVRPKSMNMNAFSSMFASSHSSPMLLNGQSSSNIRVVARFRPFNAFESDLGGDKSASRFDSDLTVSIKHGNELDTFTFDHVFPPSALQSEVYATLGEPTIEDVLTGYNGTIFAYGQSGSGKTFTMMGPDIYDEDLRGLTPRAAAKVFEYVARADPEVEFTLKCSMLEIYKETLRDLLNSEACDLKIKEDPRRDIYVQNLTEACVVDEDEMLELISLGEHMRTVASTRLNKSSSRSHQLFMLEVRQKLPNDSEKRGILNLVDLAGSENVGLSGVTGIKLEEAKKINLSLSALGNVIFALVSHNDHVPYRDSKLTRLLQESLGGNYKTNLIVACSPSSRSVEETLNTLRFAQRAKNIKNRVKVNIKSSPDAYLKLIEQLKKDIAGAHKEILLLRGGALRSQRSSMCNSPTSGKRKRPPRIKMASRGDSGNESKDSEDVRPELSDNLHDKLSLFETDSLNSSSFRQPRPSAVPPIDKAPPGRLEQEFTRLSKKLADLEQKLIRSREKQLKSEQKAHEYYECYHKTLHLINKDSLDNGLLRRQNEILNSQVRS
jgi:kinesin family protein 5